MKLSIQAGSTSQSVNVFIQDSASTTGGGKSGLAFNTSGLTCYYTFAGANATATAVTLATLAAVNSAFSSGGFKEIDATNMPGGYRFDIPNAALATSKGRSVTFCFQGASGMAPLWLEIELTGWDSQDAVHGGMTALPNAAAEAAGGLYTRGTGAGQIKQTNNGEIDSNVTTNNDKTGYALSAAGQQAVADAFLARNVAGGSSSGRTVSQAIQTLRNKQAIVAGVYTCYATDDTTPLFEANVTTAAGNPMSAWAPTT